MSTEFTWCPSCGSELAFKGQPFCARCGAALAPADNQPAEAVATAVSTAARPLASLRARFFLIAGALVVLALVAGLFFVFSGKSSGGSITFDPATISCSSPHDLSITITLPSSVKGSDRISIETDGTSNPSTVVEDTGGIPFKKQSDGTWKATSSSSMSAIQMLCQNPSLVSPNPLGVGKHTYRVLDANKHVLAQGSFTVKP